MFYGARFLQSLHPSLDWSTQVLGILQSVPAIVTHLHWHVMLVWAQANVDNPAVRRKDLLPSNVVKRNPQKEIQFQVSHSLVYTLVDLVPHKFIPPSSYF